MKPGQPLVLGIARRHAEPVCVCQDQHGDRHGVGDTPLEAYRNALAALPPDAVVRTVRGVDGLLSGTVASLSRRLPDGP